MSDFANILFGGPCNRSCYFCIGRQLPARVQQSNLDLYPLTNQERFVAEVLRLDIRQLVFTGTTTDPLLYRHQARLLEFLRSRLPGRSVSLHTNGVLALARMELVQQYDKICLSFPSFRSSTYATMMGSPKVPDLAAILEQARVEVKVSCLVSEHNLAELAEFLQRCAALGVRRMVLRRLYGEVSDWSPLAGLRPVRFYRRNPVYDLDGMEVTCWTFDTSTSTSLNLYPDGTLSQSYLLAESPELLQATG